MQNPPRSRGNTSGRKTDGANRAENGTFLPRGNAEVSRLFRLIAEDVRGEIVEKNLNVSELREKIDPLLAE